MTATPLGRHLLVTATPPAGDDARTVELEASHPSTLLFGQAAAAPARAAAAHFADVTGACTPVSRSVGHVASSDRRPEDGPGPAVEEVTG